MELIKMYGELGISEKVLNYGREIEKSLHDRFEAIDKTAEYNQLKVIKPCRRRESAISISPELRDTATMTLDVTRWRKSMRRHSTARTPLSAHS